MAGNISENPLGPETLNNPETFLDTVYHTAINRYVNEPGAAIIEVIEPRGIDNWDSVAPKPQGPTLDLPAELKKGALIEQDGLVRGFVLTDGFHSYYDREPQRSFQFGITRPDKMPFEWSDDELRLLFGISYGSDSGEVYFDRTIGKLSTNGWADYLLNGGSFFKGLKKEEQLSPEGIEAVMEFIERTFEESAAMRSLRRERKNKLQDL